MKSPDYMVFVPVAVSFVPPACVAHLIVLLYALLIMLWNIVHSLCGWVLLTGVTQVISGE